MKTTNEKSHNPLMDGEDTRAAERLPWHKPEVQRLIVSLDTASGGGSNLDDASPDPFGPT
jgi:hypothetical protein